MLLDLLHLPSASVGRLGRRSRRLGRWWAAFPCPIADIDSTWCIEILSFACSYHREERKCLHTTLIKESLASMYARLVKIPQQKVNSQRRI